MNRHARKMIAPILITSVVVIYYVFYFMMVINIVEGIMKYILGVIPVIVIMLMIMVCKERIEEIRKGEEDDLGKY